MSRGDPPSGAGQLGTQTIYQGRVIDLSLDRVRLPNGEEAQLEMVRHPGAAVALPLITGESGVEHALLVRQYRYASGGWLLEVPGGKLDGNEAPELCARRELAEEIGLVPGSLEPLGSIWTTPGFTDERIWLFIARDLEPVPGGAALESHEVLEVESIPLRDAVAMAAGGEISDGKTVATLLRAGATLGIVP